MDKLTHKMLGHDEFGTKEYLESISRPDTTPSKLKGWALSSDREKTYLRVHLQFPDFLTSFAFASKVALLAEKRKHHPDMTIGYNYVNLILTTHAANQTLTPADCKLA